MANFVYDFSCAMVLFLIFMNGVKGEYDYTQKVFNSFVITVQVFLLLDGFAWLCQIKYTRVTCFIETIIMSLIFLFQGLQGLFWLLYEECYLNKKNAISKTFLIIASIQIVASCVLVVSNLFTNCLFYINVEEGYVRGKLYAVNYVLYGIYFVTAIILGIKIFLTKEDKNIRKACLINLFGVFIVLICFILQLLFLGVNLVSPALSIVILMLYLSIQKTKLEGNKIRLIKNLEARTFGNFDILYRGQSIKFKRSKSKELIAYLIDRKGVSVSLNELYSVLWEKDYVDESTKSQLRNIISDIRQTFTALEIDGFFIKDFNSCRINPEFISCDYFDLLENLDTKRYPGEYMNQYSWAESTAGYLERLAEKSK